MKKLRYRELAAFIKGDLKEKMIFIGGPRQVGKTTLAVELAKGFKSHIYLNWDRRDHRDSILNAAWRKDVDCLVFDEIHKYHGWKSHIKGLWDTRFHGEKYLVTGSSRLDVYRRGGDSLQGRYHYYRLHPFSLREMERPLKRIPLFPETPPEFEFNISSKLIRDLLHYGGFPEPLLTANERTLKRWQHERLERVFREDIRTVENVQLLSKLEILGALLPPRVGAPLSMLSLAQDLEVNVRTVQNWVEILSRNYYLFRVPPWSKRLERALKKESKYYLWDWSEIPEPGFRFENMVASHLLKWCHLHEDAYGIDTKLYYIRDREKREVDFLVTWEKKPWMIIECKFALPDSLRSLKYFGERLDVKKRYCVVFKGSRDYYDRNSGTRVLPAAKFLMQLV